MALLRELFHVGKLLLLPCVVVFCGQTTTAQWWNASYNHSLARILAGCPAGHVAENITLCSLTEVEQKAMVAGANEGLESCRHEFSNHRWGCQSASWPIFMSKVHKESAFTHAVISAGVSLALMRVCANGDSNSEDCLCGGKSEVCGAHAKYGHERSKLLDELVKESTLTKKRHVAVHLHNTLVGRQAVQSVLDMTKKCRCSGTSGSCMTQTCWTRLPSITEITAKIKNQYKKASRIKRKKHPKKTLSELLENSAGRPSFLRRSPNYCEQNLSEGVAGTAGRQCNGKQCKKLCCNRPSRTKTITKQCNCKFFYCCRLRCEQCSDRTQFCL